MTSAAAAPADGADARVVVVILTYGRAHDAIRAIESLRDSTHAHFRIVLVDNASPDGTYATVRDWAFAQSGFTSAEVTPYAPGGAFDGLADLSLMAAGRNGGFAAGNNVAIRWLLRCQGWTHLWVLNPDTVVEPGAMAALARRAHERPDAGMIGARICGDPGRDRIQNYGGGQLRKWFAVGRSLGLGEPADAAVDVAAVERAMDYVVGCSMFLRRAYVEDVGLMEEGYFLYNEEFDWCLRRGRFALAYAHDAVVYHQLGASIGSAHSRAAVSPFSLFWNIRNRFRFAWRFFPYVLPTVYLGCWYEALKMARAGAWRNAGVVVATMHGLKTRP